MRQRIFGIVRRRALGALALVMAVATGLGIATANISDDTHEVRTFRFTYSVAVVGIPEGAEQVSVWIPIPTTDSRQVVRDLTVTAPIEHAITHETRYDNAMVYLTAKAPLPSSLNVQFEAVIERRAFNVMSEGRDSPGDDQPTARDLEADALVPIDGIIADQARVVTVGCTTDLAKAHAIYNYVTDTMTYDKSGEGWGRGDALFACNALAGNCTDFHSLIIGMSRASGIPARFVIGFPIPENREDGEIPGYHCWAEVFIDDIGWLPMDSSEASKHKEKRGALFGGLDADRVQFSQGRDLQLEPRASGPVNYFIYPYVEVDGERYSRVKRHFSFSDVGL